MKANRYQLIETIIPAAGLALGQQLFFQDQPQLRTQADQTVIISGIEAFDINTVAAGPSGTVTASEADLQNAYLVLNVAGTDNLKYIPFVKMKSIQTNGAGAARSSAQIPFELDGLDRIDWTKSYIQAAGAITANRSILLGVYYQYQPKY